MGGYHTPIAQPHNNVIQIKRRLRSHVTYDVVKINSDVVPVSDPFADDFTATLYVVVNVVDDDTCVVRRVSEFYCAVVVLWDVGDKITRHLNNEKYILRGNLSEINNHKSQHFQGSLI